MLEGIVIPCLGPCRTVVKRQELLKRQHYHQYRSSMHNEKRFCARSKCSEAASKAPAGQKGNVYVYCLFMRVKNVVCL